ncbi:hypothetical protein EZS27_003472 [termite gut metagenome]|uniref:Uncharacterized protein n=1 Tax=termite gut metagenome TaxID=433724 RepID=A0A5J4SSE0_9ZZZZ
MKYIFGEQFSKDIEKLSKQHLALLLQIVSEVEEAKSIEDISCRKLAGGTKRAYRIRMGDYRITNNTCGNYYCKKRSAIRGFM